MSGLDKGLRTERLIIRNPKPEDYEYWVKMFTDRENLYYMQDLLVNSEKEVKERLEDAIADISSERREKYFLTVETKEGEYIGQTGYTVEAFTPAGKIAHIGYFFLKEYHNKGYATESLKELLRFAFEEDGVYRLKTGLFAENKASERVMLKCGLIREGCYKEAEWLDGKLRDRLSYRILKGEWIEKNKGRGL